MPDPASPPASSLIICSRDRARMLRDTVESVLSGNAVPSEIVIVDGSAPPGPSLARLGDARGCAIRQVSLPGPGLCRARNRGVREAAHELLAFIDDDMLVEASWYRTLVEALASAGPGSVVTGRVLAAPSDDRDGFAPSLVVAEDPAVYRGRIGTDVLAAGHMAMYRSAIGAAGPFDERLGSGSTYPAADDNEFGFRLLEAGYAIVYEPRAIVYHRAWRTPRDYLPLRWSYGKGKGGFYGKYLSLRDPYMLGRMVRDVGRRARVLPYRLVVDPRRAIGDIIYVAGIAVGLGRWIWRERRRGEPGGAPAPEYGERS